MEGTMHLRWLRLPLAFLFAAFLISCAHADSVDWQNFTTSSVGVLGTNCYTLNSHGQSTDGISITANGQWVMMGSFDPGSFCGSALGPPSLSDPTSIVFGVPVSFVSGSLWVDEVVYPPAAPPPISVTLSGYQQGQLVCSSTNSLTIGTFPITAGGYAGTGQASLDCNQTFTTVTFSVQQGSVDGSETLLGTVNFSLLPLPQVPEPPTGLLVAAGLLALLGMMWMRNRHAGAVPLRRNSQLN